MEILIAAILTIITAATPLLFAALGDLVTEKSGVLNLGLEGMMIMGAVIGFFTVHHTDSVFIAIVASMIAGALTAAIFALLVLKFHASQVPTGLALTIFGIGLSALIGQSMIGVAYTGIPKIAIPFLSSIPVIRPFAINALFLFIFTIVYVFCSLTISVILVTLITSFKVFIFVSISNFVTLSIS